MADKNIQFDASKYRRSTSDPWQSWSSFGSGEAFFDFSWGGSYILRIPASNIRITRVRISSYFSVHGDFFLPNPKITAGLYTADPQNGGSPIAEVEHEYISDGSLLFDFKSFSVDATGYLYVAFQGYNTQYTGEYEGSFPNYCTVTYTDIPALSPSIVQPSGTKSGAEAILFSWENSGSGTQTKAELEWSTDGANWNSLTTVGTSLTYTAAANKFPAGTIYWHIRVTSSYGIVSDWVRGSFTVRYAGATVTLTTPTSGSRSGAEDIAFGWSINPGDGYIVQTLMEISTDDGLTWQTIINHSGSVTSYTAEAGQLPAGPVKWRVTAYNQYQDASAVTPVQAGFTVTYSAVSQVVPVNSPTSGIISAGSSRAFTVALQASDVVHTPFTVSAATFYWRSGESGDFTAVTMTPGGNTASVTIPAGTFPSGIIQWYAEATDNTGRTTSTDTYTLQALNAAVEAAPVSPINTLESGSGPIVFRWTYGSIDGSVQGKAQIRYSDDGGASWDTLPDIVGSDTVTTVPAGTFPGGTIIWQVRAYNEAGTEGPWSQSVSFISFAAPLVSGVIGDGKPFLTVSWQVEGQQAYEVEANGKTYGPYFGEDVRSYTLPEPLSNGDYIIRVRAQNRYGLWSEWAEGNVSIVNVSGTGVVIYADSGESISLRWPFEIVAPVIFAQPQDQQGTTGSVSFAPKAPPTTAFGIVYRQWYFRDPGGEWQTVTGAAGTRSTLTVTCSAEIDGRQYRCRLYNSVGEVWTRIATYRYLSPNQASSPLITGYFPASTGYFLIYRDGELIGKTYGNEFYDRTTLGTHEYSVIQVLPDGYYMGSSPASLNATASVKCPMIGKLDGGDFIELKLSENSRRTQSFARRRQVAYTQYAGAAFPSAEIGEHETLTGSFDVSYLQRDAAAADAFEALLGDAVILKTPGGKVVVGILEGWDLGDMKFYKSYRCTLQQMDWGEFIDESTGI